MLKIINKRLKRKIKIMKILMKTVQQIARIKLKNLKVIHQKLKILLRQKF